LPDFHRQAWITSVEVLSVYNRRLGEEHECGEPNLEIQLAIARAHGFESPGAFVRQGCDRDRGGEAMGESD
jgi:hypothetical protein